MADWKIIDLLRTFETKDFNSLVLFIENEEFNTNLKLKELMGFFSKHYPEFSPKYVNEAALGGLLFDKGMFDSRAFQRLTYKLKLLVEQFILIQNVQKCKIGDKVYYENQVHLLNYYRKNGLFSRYRSSLKKAKKELKQESAKSTIEFYADYQFEDQEHLLQAFADDNHTTDINYSNAIRSLDIYYIYDKLKWICLLLTRGSVMDADLHDRFEEQTLELLKAFNNIPVQIQTWQKAYHMLKKKDAHSYRDLKLSFYKNINALTKGDQRILFTFLINNLKHLHENNLEYYQEMFQLYKEVLDKDILLIDRSILIQHFLNITTIALHLDLDEWVEDFHLQYSKRIQSKNVDWNAIIHLSKSMILIHQDGWEEALDELNEIRTERLYFKVAEKRIRMICYYEQKSFDAFDSLTIAFRKFLSVNRKSLGETHIEASRNFISAINRMWREPKTFHKHIDEYQPLPEKYWFRKKAKVDLKKSG